MRVFAQIVEARGSPFIYRTGRERVDWTAVGQLVEGRIDGRSQACG
jgi:hypothetical protein